MKYLINGGNSMYDAIIVGAGFAGATIAERLAQKNKKVLVIDKRNHIGGNAYDYEKEGILIHKYGPHIFHTNSKEVFEYLSNFTKWYAYEHRVLGHVQNKIVPIPFNMTSIEECFESEKAEKLKKILVEEYGEGKKVPIMELLKNEDADIKELADFIFENVFKYYTMKQWGLKAEEIAPGVTARVPVNVSYDDRYFNDTYQYLPVEGYTAIFENMLNHPNIEVQLETDAKNVLKFIDGKTYYLGEKYDGQVVYTGELDRLFDYELGDLPYRSLDLVLERKAGTFQKAATENYPCDKTIKPFTRITEYKHFLENEPSDVTYIHTEYPLAFDKNAEKGNVPYYPIFTLDNQKMYESYVEISKQYPNLHLLGRLAEYKYYNMDAIVYKALRLAEKL